MTDGNSRQLTLTPTEAEKFNALAAGEPMWIVREGDWPKACPWADPTDCNGEHCDCLLGPPVEFVQACAPCQNCGGDRLTLEWEGDETFVTPCPVCRIELVGPCAHCEIDHLGYAYAVANATTGRCEPLPIVAFGDWLRDETISPRCVVVADGNIYIRGAGFPVPNITDRLAHYDLATLPGQWAIEVRKA